MSQQEYTIHIFGQDLTSQDGLFRLDEIRRVGIQIGKVEDTEKTMVRTQSRALSYGAEKPPHKEGRYGSPRYVMAC